MKNKQLYLLFLLLVLIHSQPPNAPTKGLDGNPGQTLFRQIVAQQNKVELQKLQQAQAEFPVTYGQNQFTYLTIEETKQYLGGILRPLILQPNLQQTIVRSPAAEQLIKLRFQNQQQTDSKAGQQVLFKVSTPVYPNPPPKVFYVDWNGINGSYVTNVKNQGACGSCWAFAGVAQIQTFYLYNHNLYLDLSEQQMVDCVPIFDSSNKACEGGFVDSVASYSKVYGTTRQIGYPYNAASGKCMNSRINRAPYKIRDYARIVDCDTLSLSILNLHPIQVCLFIDYAFTRYTSGVIPSYNPNQGIGGHCVQLVGAKSDGTSDMASNYWIIKNSWGTSFGQNGYMRLYRDATDLNGFGSMCNYALYMTK